MNHLELLHMGIHDFVDDFQLSPFDFLYERDLQALLFSTCSRSFQGKRILMAGGYHGPGAYGGKDYIETLPIKCEYPISRVFDIALINAQSVESFDQALWKQRGWKNDRFWDQPVRAAIEIKYYQLGDSARLKRVAVDADLAKLYQYLDDYPDREFLGIALLCIQTDKLAENFSTLLSFGNRRMAKEDPPPIAGIFRYVVTPSSVERYVA